MKQVLIGLIKLVAFTIFILLCMQFAYMPTREGTLYLKRAREGEAPAMILRERHTGFHHIKADSMLSAVYAQGFAHAQDRLWKMEKTRRMGSGRLAEIFGAKVLPVDKFSLAVGYRRAAQQTWDMSVAKDANADPDAILSQDEMDMLWAYADGINDFLESAMFILPPEFYAVGLTKLEPWHPVDSLVVAKIINFNLSYNWSQDLLRYILGSELEKVDAELRDLVEELVPFNMEHAHNLEGKTILSEQEVREAGLDDPSGATLMERYKSRTPMERRTKEEIEKEREEEARREEQRRAAREEAERRRREEQERLRREEEAVR